MIGKIKKVIQDKLYQGCLEEYQRELRYQTDPYLLWIRENEKSADETQEELYPSLGVVYMENCDQNFSLSDVNKEYIIFASKQGRIAVSAFGEIMQYFKTHKDTDIVYADEDVWMLTTSGEDAGDDADDEHKHRIFPWTKPMWSPDTLFSFFYFGNIFAIQI